MELTEKNWAAWRFYREAKATGLTGEERGDPVVRRCFAVLDPITRAFEAKQDAGFMAVELAKILVGLKKGG